MNNIFCSNRTRTLVAYSCHWLIMGKVKVGIYCYLTADVLTEVLQKWPLSSPLPDILILSKPLNLIGSHGSRKAKFAKKKNKKIISSEAIRGIKLKLCRKVHNISLYKMAFLLSLLISFCCYGKLKFPLTYNGKIVYNGKIENWPLLLSQCRYCDKRFTEMFLK